MAMEMAVDTMEGGEDVSGDQWAHAVDEVELATEVATVGEATAKEVAVHAVASAATVSSARGKTAREALPKVEAVRATGAATRVVATNESTVSGVVGHEMPPKQRR